LYNTGEAKIRIHKSKKGGDLIWLSVRIILSEQPSEGNIMGGAGEGFTFGINYYAIIM
jgi:hypothetical protein